MNKFLRLTATACPLALPNLNTDQILPRIEQLEQRDPTLGGPQWQPGFNELRRKHRR